MNSFFHKRRVIIILNLQELMKELYLEKDLKRGLEKTILKLVEEGRLIDEVHDEFI